MTNISSIRFALILTSMVFLFWVSCSDSDDSQEPLPEPDPLVNDLTLLCVNHQVSGGERTGRGWTNAFKELSDAIETARLDPKIKQIWVAKGTYTPTKKVAETDFDGNPTTDRDKAFILVKDVKIYGGFSGEETSLDDRNWKANQTVLSGVVGKQGTREDSVYSVVYSVGEVGNACLDGFIITGGSATPKPHFLYGYETYDKSVEIYGRRISQTDGGGINIYDSSPAISNVVITENISHVGGGMFFAYSSSVLNNIVVSKNKALTHSGGGIFCSRSPITLTQVNITENIAFEDGGGISLVLESSAKLINVIINKNKISRGSGGGLRCSGFSNVILTNVLICQNQARYGGGMYNTGDYPILSNVTISGNIAWENGGGIGNYGVATFQNTIIWGNTAPLGSDIYFNRSTGSFQNCLYGEYESYYEASPITDLGNNLNQDPLFVNPQAGNYHLSRNSPAINHGNISLNTEKTDLDGNPRIIGSSIDIGAYEFK
jgi:predicted outer membrane repeat protein